MPPTVGSVRQGRGDTCRTEAVRSILLLRPNDTLNSPQRQAQHQTRLHLLPKCGWITEKPQVRSTQKRKTGRQRLGSWSAQLLIQTWTSLQALREWIFSSVPFDLHWKHAPESLERARSRSSPQSGRGSYAVSWYASGTPGRWLCFCLWSAAACCLWQCRCLSCPRRRCKRGRHSAATADRKDDRLGSTWA